MAQLGNAFLMIVILKTLVLHSVYTITLPPPAILVPGQPHALTILAYRPPYPGQLAASYPSKYVVVRRREIIPKLVQQLNSLPVPQGITSCPMDNGSHDELLFAYPNGHRITVQVDLTGCRTVQAGGHTASAATDNALFQQLTALLAGPSAVALGSHLKSGYTISHTVNGIQLTVHFQQRAYPQHALIVVTATIRNLSHRHLAVTRASYPYGLCSGPAVSIVAVNAAGQIAGPVSPIAPPVPSCPFLIPRSLPLGQSVIEHQLIVLWAPRLRITAQLFNFVHNCYCGFTFPATAARLHLYPAPAPTISVQNTNGSTVAAVSPPPGARGPLYYQSWGSCPGSAYISSAFYWTPWPDRMVPAICAHPRQWHLDVAWLNWPVASLNLRT